MLLEFDIAFWEPGDERTVFRYPGFTFSTPICFEDACPAEVREFARAGAEVIVNISNDYWSLTEVAAQQHFVAGLFRAVELRRPMVRSTASGVTAYVDPWGRVRAQIPQYREDYLVVDVEVPTQPVTTVYRRTGDWVPRSAAIIVMLLAAAAAIPRGIAALANRRLKGFYLRGAARMPIEAGQYNETGGHHQQAQNLSGSDVQGRE